MECVRRRPNEEMEVNLGMVGLHYLAIPPSLVSAVVGQLGRSGRARGGRVSWHKPLPSASDEVL